MLDTYYALIRMQKETGAVVSIYAAPGQLLFRFHWADGYYWRRSVSDEELLEARFDVVEAIIREAKELRERD